MKLTKAQRNRWVNQFGIHVEHPVHFLRRGREEPFQPQQVPTDQSATPFSRDRGRIWSASQTRAAA